MGSHSNIKKLEFFSYSSPVLYNNSQYLSLISNTVFPLKERKIIFNFKKWGKISAFILLAIAIKSICQYFLGAQETSLEKILSGLDYPFYQGCILGGVIMSFFQDNWNNMWDFLHKSFTIKLDSGDEDSGDESLKKIDKGKNPEQVTSKKGLPSGSGAILISREELIDLTVKYSIAAGEIGKDTMNYYDNTKVLRDGLKLYNALEIEKLSINNPTDANKFFIPLLREHGSLYSKLHTSRLAWIMSRAANLEPENKIKVDDSVAKIRTIREKYLSTITELGKHSDPATQAKQYYAALNEQRNSTNKEFNKADDIILKDLKTSPFCTINHEDCKNLVKILKDYTNIKKECNIQDSNLKKKLGEVLNRRS